jgi:hypothetical protein
VDSVHFVLQAPYHRFQLQHGRDVLVVEAAGIVTDDRGLIDELDSHKEFIRRAPTLADAEDMQVEVDADKAEQAELDAGGESVEPELEQPDSAIADLPEAASVRPKRPS